MTMYDAGSWKKGQDNKWQWVVPTAKSIYRCALTTGTPLLDVHGLPCSPAALLTNLQRMLILAMNSSVRENLSCVREPVVYLNLL